MTERDENGRFVKGNGIGKASHAGGRPKKAREERYYQITQSACTFADWREIVKKAVGKAKAGDAVARKWLSDYLMGPPPKELRITGADGGPVEVAHSGALIDKAKAVLEKFTADDG